MTGSLTNATDREALIRWAEGLRGSGDKLWVSEQVYFPPFAFLTRGNTVHLGTDAYQSLLSFKGLPPDYPGVPMPEESADGLRR